MYRTRKPLTIKIQHTTYNPNRDKENVKAIKELLATALYELYQKQAS